MEYMGITDADTLDTTSEINSATPFVQPWVVLRGFLINLVLNLKTSSKERIESKVEDVKKQHGGGAQTQKEINSERVKDTLESLIKDSQGRARFMEQCYLLHNIRELAKLSRERPERFKHLKIIDGDSDIIITRLNKKAGFEEMMNITQDKLALLQPKIQLYKREYSSDGGTLKDVKFVFESHTTAESIDSILQTHSGRGGGVGIQSMKIEYQGTDMESAKRILKVGLKIYVQDMQAFFKEGTEDRASFMDLIVPSRALKGGPRDMWHKDKFTGLEYHKTQVHETKNFEIKAVFGWSVPTSSQGFVGKKLKTALQHNKAIALLTLIDHTFSFNQDGTMMIDIEYHGRLEGLLEDDERTSLFETAEVRDSRRQAKLEYNTSKQKINEQVKSEALSVRKKYLVERAEDEGKNLNNMSIDEFEQKLIDDGDDEFNLLRKGQKRQLDAVIEKAKKKVKEEESKILKLKHAAYKRLIAKLESRGLSGAGGGIVYVKVDKQSLDFYTKTHGGSFGSFEDALSSTSECPAPKPISGLDKVKSKELSTALEKSLQETKKSLKEKDKPTDKKEKSTKQSAPAPSIVGNDYEFAYFYLGDLIDSALELLRENGLNNEKELFDVITGPFVYGTTKAKINLNIADIPISIHEFQYWFTENVVKKGKTRWSFSQFLRDVATKIVFPALGGRCYESGSPIVSRDGNRFGMSVLSFPSNIFKNEKKRLDIKSLDRAIVKQTEKLAGEINPKVYEAVLLHVDFTPAVSKKGDFKEDLRDGIYHLTLGRDRGLVKEIRLTKDALPFYTSDRLDYEGTIERISHPYVADIKMVGNTYFKPGSRVFVNPALTGGGAAHLRNSVVSKLGLGGYYVILGTVLTIRGHTFETELRTKWEANGFKTGPAVPSPTKSGQISKYEGVSSIVPASITESGETVTIANTIREATAEEKQAAAKLVRDTRELENTIAKNRMNVREWTQTRNGSAEDQRAYEYWDSIYVTIYKEQYTSGDPAIRRDRLQHATGREDVMSVRRQGHQIYVTYDVGGGKTEEVEVKLDRREDDYVWRR